MSRRSAPRTTATCEDWDARARLERSQRASCGSAMPRSRAARFSIAARASATARSFPSEWLWHRQQSGRGSMWSPLRCACARDRTEATEREREDGDVSSDTGGLAREADHVSPLETGEGVHRRGCPGADARQQSVANSLHPAGTSTTLHDVVVMVFDPRPLPAAVGPDKSPPSHVDRRDTGVPLVIARHVVRRVNSFSFPWWSAPCMLPNVCSPVTLVPIWGTTGPTLDSYVSSSSR
jgi:hypothetical protein